jgi:20S proteasome alpha/beta subunit
MTSVYNRQGEPISMGEFARLFEDVDYSVLRQEETADKHYWVSTVWLGIDHNFSGEGPPIIFETMVFAQTTDAQSRLMEGTSCERYATEEQAIRGHESTVLILNALSHT